MSKAKAQSREPSMRDSLGLTAGEAGDPAGVAKFLYWAAGEVSNLGFFGCQPELLATRLRGLSHDMKELSEFARGLSEATKAKPTPTHHRKG